MKSPIFGFGLICGFAALLALPASPAKAYDPSRQQWKLAPYDPRSAVPPRSSHSRREVVRERIIEHRGPGYTIEREIIYSPRSPRADRDGHRWRDESDRRSYRNNYGDPYRDPYRNPYRGSHYHRPDEPGFSTSHRTHTSPVSGHIGYSSGGQWHIGVELKPHVIYPY
jgi:hypothetical protein